MTEINARLQKSDKNKWISFADRKKLLIIAFGILALTYLLIRIFTSQIESLRVVEFAFIAIIFGFAPAYYFRNVFKFDNIIGWLTNSAVLSILFIPLLFLIAGWLGINIVFSHSVLFLYICSLLGLLSLFILADDQAISNSLTFKRIRQLDILNYAILIITTFILTILNFSQVFPRWDAFTYWGLDAKYLFEFNRLRDSSFDVLERLKYTSFYPIFYSVIYDIYGTVVEQYASWINVFLNFLAVLLIYNKFLSRRIFEKLLVVSMLLITSFGAINATFMFSMYADMLCAFILLLYGIVITGEKPEIEKYSQRMALVLLTASALFFIKEGFLIITFLLISAWIIYDSKFLFRNKNQLIKRIDLWIVLLSIFSIFLLRHINFLYIPKIEQELTVYTYYVPRFASFSASVEYIRNLLLQLLQNSPFLFGLWIIGLSTIIYVGIIKVFNRQYLFVYSLSFGVFFFYCVTYFLTKTELLSGSLIRYTSIVMYLVPLMFVYFPIDLSQKKSVLFVPITLLGLFFSVKQFSSYIPVIQNFKLTNGAYSDSSWLKDYSAFADNVLQITGDKAKILIADEDGESGSVTNMLLPDIYIRYFLMNNSVGGQYRWIPKDELYTFAINQDADYILLLSYTDSFEICGDIFDDQTNYLLEVEEKYVPDSKVCPYLESNIITLK